MAHRPRLLPTVLALLVLLALPTPAALAASGAWNDPDDVDLRLDLRTISHADDAATVTYTVATYGSFPDSAVDFRWGLDETGDGKVDLYVSTQWEDDNRTLVATVDDLRERVLARATVTRPAPDAVRVSFPRAVLGTVTSYRYNVIAVTDLDDNGETDSGERDVAPDTGFYEHRLGPELAAGSSPTEAANQVTTSAAPSPAPAAQAGPGGPPAAGPHAAPGAGRSVGTPSASASSGSRLPPSPDTGPALDARPLTEVPRTGLPHEGLATAGAALLLIGLACRSIARKPDPGHNLGGT